MIGLEDTLLYIIWPAKSFFTFVWGLCRWRTGAVLLRSMGCTTTTRRYALNNTSCFARCRLHQ